MNIFIKESYISFIKGSIGSSAYRNLYVDIDGNKVDILKDGKLSCAYFVSSVLFLFKMLKSQHATVNGTIKDLKESGWTETVKPQKGDVVVWKELDSGDGEGPHKHLGFFMGEDLAISNDSGKRCPMEHGVNFSKREIETIFNFKELN